MTSKYNKISDVAKLFGIPVSTLHYWEKEGLFNVARIEDNKYRKFSHSDILNIWEIMLYRELEVPIDRIGSILDSNVDNLLLIYEDNEIKINNQINNLNKKLERINRQKEAIATISNLRDSGIVLAVPDVDRCVLDEFTIESIKCSLVNPYNCMMYISGREKIEYVRCLAINDKDSITKSGENTNIVWHKDTDKKYMQFLWKINIDNVMDNNLESVVLDICKMGYKTGEVIGRYLLIATEEGKRYEYYKGFIEIK